MKILSIPAKTLEKQKLNFSRSARFHMKTRVYLNIFSMIASENVYDCHNILRLFDV